MKIVYELNENLERIEYLKECTKNLAGTLEICNGVYVFSKDKLTAEQAINGTMMMLQDYCEFLYENILKLQDDMKVLLEKLQKVAEENEVGETICKK